MDDEWMNGNGQTNNRGYSYRYSNASDWQDGHRHNIQSSGIWYEQSFRHYYLSQARQHDLHGDIYLAGTIDCGHGCLYFLG
jgi:hypothetical protein